MSTSAKPKPKYADLTDPELLSLCAKKDEAAFEVLLSRYERFVFSAVRYDLKNDDDAFDVSQEVFIRLYNAAGGFRCESTLKTWLFRMCKNCACDFMRKNYKHKFLSLSAHEDGEGECPEGHRLARISRGCYTLTSLTASCRLLVGAGAVVGGRAFSLPCHLFLFPGLSFGCRDSRNLRNSLFCLSVSE